MTLIQLSPDVEKVAKKVIANHHNHLLHVPMYFVTRDKASRSNGIPVWGKLKCQKGIPAMLALGQHDTDGAAYFIVEIAGDIWEKLSEPHREALVDHELMHATVDRVDGKLILGTRSHDLEEFGDIVARHGLWREDVTSFLADIGKDTLEQFALNL